MLQLTHRTHIITWLVLASISLALGMVSFQSPTTNSSINTTTTTITSSIPATTTTTTTTASATTPATITRTATRESTLLIRNEGKICKGIHIRNDLKSFEQLKGCRIIDGPLTIALVSHINNSKDYDNITFPLLTEVTEYLLFFRVTNLTTLSRLFPNLSVIRGNELVSNYALIIYEMMELQEINLPKLTDILRGSVRIESNPNLCYTSTVNWQAICKHIFTPHFIKDNNARCRNRCKDTCKPWDLSKNANTGLQQFLEGDVIELGSDNNRSLFCSNEDSKSCHESCDYYPIFVPPDRDNGFHLPFAPDGSCCSPMCAGGCYEGNRSDQCVSCRFVSQGNKCVKQCDSHLYEYKRQCIEKSECETKKYEPQSSQCDKGPEETSYKPIKLKAGEPGRCQETCPAGQEEDPLSKHECKPCDKGKCRKICSPKDRYKPIMVTDIDSLREMHGCNAINGSLELSLKGGRNVLHELETVFQDLEEIDGYLKITRSYPIITLGFLRKLKVIRGSDLDREYTLEIIDNPNLQELFVNHRRDADSNEKQLEILGGRIFVHNNPRLCPHKIESLKDYAVVSDWDKKDVSPDNNGDKETCDALKLKVEYINGGSYNVKIGVENFATKLEDPRKLLYYLINYREVLPNVTVTIFDGRDGCNSQNDVWYTVEETPSKNARDFQEVYITVKPATRYALYVKTFTILDESNSGALSDMIYFETAPDTPGMPRDLKVLESDPYSLELTLLPPAKPNGVIVRYFVTVTREFDEEVRDLDVCESIVSRDKVTQVLTRSEPSVSQLVQTMSNKGNDVPSSSPDSAEKCSKVASSTNPDIQLDQVTFQDRIIDIVYLKQPCPSKAPSKPVKKKRSIEHDLGTTENPNENSLPRKPVTTDQSVPRAFINISDTTILAAERKSQHKNLASIGFNSSSPQTEAYIPANESKDVVFKIENLTHYSSYKIQVQACHGDFRVPNTHPLPGYSKCSLQAYKLVRTKPIPENDKINRSTIVFSPANETSKSLIQWEGPENPNGLILAYRIRYRLKNSNSEIWSEQCVNLTTYNLFRGILLDHISPGVYLLGIQTVSMYTEEKFWSGEFEFEIPPDEFLSSWAWTSIFIASLILVLVGVATGAYCFQKNSRDDLIYASVNPDYVQYDPDEWEVDKTKLIVGLQIGTGSFGMVYKGQLITEKGKRDCAVKTVPPSSTAKQRMDFLREASIMKQFDTYHVVKLLGVVSVTTPVYVIMEYMENGDLKDFLRKQRELHQKQNKTLVDGIYLMAAQIADGMAYLASKKFVHRDLAARNCMVGENRIVKIGDFGLTRDIYANDYYRRDTQGRLPVRWMAPESLSDNICTSASDAWSYGIVLWEIVTFSAYPYQGLSNDEVIKRITQGYTMPRPEHCPDKLYNIMERCWRKYEKDRPSFLDIVGYLLPETDGKLYPNCYYKKPKCEGDSIALSISDDTNAGIESYPLLSWPTSNNQRANNLTNGENHINHQNHRPVNHIDRDQS